MKELMHAHQAKLIADNINDKSIVDIKAAITGEIMKMANEGQYKAIIFIENSSYKHKDEIMKWLENRGYKVKYWPGSQFDVPELDISWEEEV